MKIAPVVWVGVFWVELGELAEKGGEK